MLIYQNIDILNAKVIKFIRLLNSLQNKLVLLKKERSTFNQIWSVKYFVN